MKYMHHMLFLTGFLAMFLAGCGGGGAPGSSGSQHTQVVINSVNITAESPDLDANIHVCPDGTPETGLFREDATLTVDVSPIDPNLEQSPLPATVQECTVTYKKANEDPASPILESLTLYPNCALSEGENTCTITLLDIQRKKDYWNSVISGINMPAEYPTHYVATFRCKYYGRVSEGDPQPGYFETAYDFWLADFEKCAL